MSIRTPNTPPIITIGFEVPSTPPEDLNKNESAEESISEETPSNEQTEADLLPQSNEIETRSPTADDEEPDTEQDVQQDTETRDTVQAFEPSEEIVLQSKEDSTLTASEDKRESFIYESLDSFSDEELIEGAARRSTDAWKIVKSQSLRLSRVVEGDTNLGTSPSRLATSPPSKLATSPPPAYTTLFTNTTNYSALAIPPHVREVPNETGGNSLKERSNSSPTPMRKRTVEDFTFGKTLGGGSYARVLLATEISTGVEYAVKILSKKHIIKENKSKYVKTEKAIMDALKHPNVVMLYYTFQDPENLYFVLELCSNGELLGLIKKAGKFPEEVARFYAAEIVNALEYMHNTGFIHRDLKPENVLLDSKMHAKLNDFGTAKEIGKEETFSRSSSFTGTAEYVAPELLQNKQTGKPSDLWALGVVIYQMLTGKLMFRAQSDYQTFEKILQRDIEYPDDFPPDAKDLVDKLMNVDPMKRLGVGAEGMKELKSHPFWKDIDWNTIHLQTPPTPPIQEQKPTKNNDSDELRLKKLEEQKSSEWQRFCNNNELIVHMGLIWKKKGLFSKKRQLILTDSPRLIYIDPDKMEVKGEIPWSRDLSVSVKSKRRWTINTPIRIYLLEDVNNEPTVWENAIMSVHKRVYG